MAKYTFICEHPSYDEFTGEEVGVASKHTTQFRAETLSVMFDNFESFLRGSGFHFDGVVDVVPYEDDYAVEEDEKEDRGSAVMSSMVNDMLDNPFIMKMPGTLGSAELKFVDDGFSSWSMQEIKPLTTDQIQSLYSSER